MCGAGPCPGSLSSSISSKAPFVARAPATVLILRVLNVRSSGGLKVAVNLLDCGALSTQPRPDGPLAIGSPLQPVGLGCEPVHHSADCLPRIRGAQTRRREKWSVGTYGYQPWIRAEASADKSIPR